MATLYRSDLESIKSSVNNALNKEFLDTQKLVNAIQIFINNSNSKLQGDAWNQARSRLNIYLPALEKRKTIAVDIINAVKMACTTMENYLNALPTKNIPDVSIVLDGSMITDDWLPELNKEYAALGRKREQLKKDANDAYWVAKNNAGAGASISWGAFFNERLDGEYANIMADIQELVNYIGQMKDADANAYAQLESVINEMHELNSLVGNINDLFAPPKPNIVYVPVATSASYFSDIGTANVEDATSNTNIDANVNNSTTEVNNNKVEELSNNENTNVISPVSNENKGTSSSSTSTSNTSYNTNSSSTNKTNYSYNNNSSNNINIDEENIDTNDGLNIIDDNSETTNNISNESGYYDEQTYNNNKGGNTFGKVVGTAAVLGAAGAAGYAGYNLYKKAKENNELSEEDNEDSEFSSDIDYSDLDNVDINYDKDEI